MNPNPKSLLPLIVAGLVLGACGTKDGGAPSSSAAGTSPTDASSGEASPVFCAGVNSCSGKSECKTPKHECVGKNACTGQGILKMSAKDCKAKGGTVAPKLM